MKQFQIIERFADGKGMFHGYGNDNKMYIWDTTHQGWVIWSDEAVVKVINDAINMATQAMEKM